MTDAGVDADAGPRTIERPSPQAAVAAIEAARDAGHAVTLVGRCRLERASSDRSGSADRHVLLKPDGSVVVHGRAGANPLHRLAAVDDVDALVTDGRLSIDLGGANGRIEFERVDLVASFDLDEGAERSGVGVDRHEALRDRLIAEPDLVEPGFRPLSTERETAAGPVDLYGRDADGRAVVVEVKADRAGPAAVGQLDRYVSALRRDLHADADVRGVLVAPSATERTRALLAERGYAFSARSPDG